MSIKRLYCNSTKYQNCISIRNRYLKCYQSHVKYKPRQQKTNCIHYKKNLQKILFTNKRNIKCRFCFKKKSGGISKPNILMNKYKILENKYNIIKNNIFNNTENISNIKYSLKKIIDIIHVTHGGPKILLND